MSTEAILDPDTAMIRSWWQTHRPSVWSQIQDRDRFLYREVVEFRAAVCAVQADLQRALPANLEYLDQAAAVRRTQLQAHEIVIADRYPTLSDTAPVATVR